MIQKIAFLFLLLPFFCQGQFEYTYTSERMFQTSEEFLGCTFIPETEAIPKENYEKRINPGTVIIKILPNYLYVTEDGNEIAFNMNSINPTEFGFRLDLMNASKPTEQGHLKVFINEKKELFAFALKRNRESKEIVYYQASFPNNRIVERDTKYFTDISDISMLKTYYIYGKTVKPFYQSELSQTRIYPKDSISFVFSQREETVGKKVQKKSFCKFRYLKPAATEDDEAEMQEMEFEIVKEKEFDYVTPEGAKAKGWEFEFKKAPMGGISLFLNQSGNLVALQFGETSFKLRNKIKQNPPVKN